ncbi:MAG: hypothetical protein FWD96_02315 [Defluviitaleaceae bacterium]|nr:hypothetical protein [Defluviitaleaceae bacterium]
MGMTDRQFDAYRSELLENLKAALLVSPDNELLRAMVERIEAELRRP